MFYCKLSLVIPALYQIIYSKVSGTVSGDSMAPAAWRLVAQGPRLALRLICSCFSSKVLLLWSHWEVGTITLAPPFWVTWRTLGGPAAGVDTLSHLTCVSGRGPVHCLPLPAAVPHLLPMLTAPGRSADSL